MTTWTFGPENEEDYTYEERSDELFEGAPVGLLLALTYPESESERLWSYPVKN